MAPTVVDRNIPIDNGEPVTSVLQTEKSLNRFDRNDEPILQVNEPIITTQGSPPAARSAVFGAVVVDHRRQPRIPRFDSEQSEHA